jgi:hypothetical protein
MDDARLRIEPRRSGAQAMHSVLELMANAAVGSRGERRHEGVFRISPVAPATGWSVPAACTIATISPPGVGLK